MHLAATNYEPIPKYFQFPPPTGPDVPESGGVGCLR